MTMSLSRFSLKTALNNTLFLVIVGLGAWGATNLVRMRHLQHELVASSYVRDSLEVAADSTRRVTVAGLDTAIALWQRRAYQSEQHADKLDKQLKQETVARTNLALTVDSLRLVMDGTVTDVAGIRRADFHSYKTPFTVDVGVELPAPPARGIARVSVVVDTANVGVRLACGKPVDGIRPANVTVTTPTWLNVRVDSASQDRRLCNENKPTKKWAGAAFGLGTILGLLIHSIL
jgi:hypothetical protein